MSLLLLTGSIFPCQAMSLSVVHPALFKTALVHNLFRPQLYTLGDHRPEDHLYLPEPLIVLDEHENIHVSDFLKYEQPNLLRLNDLSYKLVRSAEKQVHVTAQEMEILRNTGWIIDGFSGLEGRRNTFPDMSGIVCFNPEHHLIVVVYRGTAGNKDGWDTNFDATKMNPQKVQKEFSKDLFDELIDMIKESECPRRLKAIKKIIRQAQKEEPGLPIIKTTYTEIQKQAKLQNIDPDLTDELFEAIASKIDLMEGVESLGYNIKGEVHKGFLKKYMSTKRDVLHLIKSHLKSMTPEDRAKVKIVFTGHSQAGATGSLALADICINHGADLFGKNFDNKKDFKFYGYFLSAARAGNKEYRKWVHQHVGRTFIVRQNVDGDPAPVSAGDARMHHVVSQVPVVGELLSKHFMLYDDTGYLLLDDSHKVWKRARELYKEQGLDISRFEEIEDLVCYVASWVMEDEENVPKFLAPKTQDTSFFWSPIKWVKKRIQTAQTINLLRRMLMGDTQAAQELEEFSEIVLMRYAHLHYGHHHPETGAVFDPEVVGRDLETMAQRGHKNELKRKAELEAAG